MKIKRIATGLASAAVGASMAMGAVFAATTLNQGLQPYVTVSGNTLSSPAVVVGPGVDTTDVIGAADIAASMVSHYAVTSMTIPGAASTTSVTGGIAINSDLNRTYKGEGLSKVKSSLTRADLPDLLSSGTFTDINGSVSTFNYKIVPAGISAAFSTPSGDTEPSLHIPVTTSTTPYNLTVNFIGGLDPSAVDSTYSINLFGKSYTFASSPVTTNTSMTLYASGGAEIVTLVGTGDTATVTSGGQSFDITLTGWDVGGTKAYLTVNTAPYAWNEGSTYTVSTVKFLVQSVDVISTGGTESTGQVKLFVGTDKLELTSGSAITRNDETKNTMVYFSSPTKKINSMTFVIYPDDDFYVKQGAPMTDPTFGTFKLALSDMTPSMTSASRDLIRLTADSSNIRLTFTNKDGMTYSNVPIVYANSTALYSKQNNNYYVHTREFNASGGTGAPANISKGDYFVLSSGDYSYMLKYNSYSYDSSDPTKTYVTLTDLSSNQNYKVYPAIEQIPIGSLSFPIGFNNGDKSVYVSLNGDNDYNDIVNITTQGLGKINLNNTAGLTGAGATTANITVVEVPLYSISGSNDPVGATFKVGATYTTTSGIRFTYTRDGTDSSAQVSTNNEWKDVSNYGSFVDITGDNNGKNAINVYNPGQRPAYANIAIGTNPVFATAGGSTGGTYNAAVGITNPVAKFSTEIPQSTSLNQDIILVGGPCANPIVKTLLNTAWSTSDSCNQWLQDATLKNSGMGLIKVVENAFGSGKKALIVAGTNAADTRALIANKVIKPSVMATLSGDEYKGSVS